MELIENFVPQRLLERAMRNKGRGDRTVVITHWETAEHRPRAHRTFLMIMICYEPHGAATATSCQRRAPGPWPIRRFSPQTRQSSKVAAHNICSPVLRSKVNSRSYSLRNGLCADLGVVTKSES